MTAAIVARDVTKTLVAKGLSGTRGCVEALKGISCELGTGVTALLGPNGAGKSTLFNIIGVRSKPTQGHCEVLRFAPGAGDVGQTRRELGFVPQRFAFLRSFMALDYVRYHLWLRDVSDAQTLEPARAGLAAVDLSSRVVTTMKKLSGGMLRRVGVASAIVGQPKLVLLDEPTVGLDPQQRMAFRDLLVELG